MQELNELYQQIIIDHSQCPRNCRVLEGYSCSEEGYNPLCGDIVKVYLSKKGDIITDISFQGSGCAISTASASLMTESIKGKTVSESLELFDVFQELVTTGFIKDVDKLGKLVTFSGVSEFPMRIKCATLAWHALKATLCKNV